MDEYKAKKKEDAISALKTQPERLQGFALNL